MDGRSLWRDSISIEKLWEKVKYEYEEVYLKAYESISPARKKLMRFFARCNAGRPHQGLNKKTQNEVYYGTLPKIRDTL